MLSWEASEIRILYEGAGNAGGQEAGARSWQNKNQRVLNDL
jgi:hypothetical protein